jgi:hypothetical protein
MPDNSMDHSNWPPIDFTKTDPNENLRSLSLSSYRAVGPLMMAAGRCRSFTHLYGSGWEWQRIQPIFHASCRVGVARPVTAYRCRTLTPNADLLISTPETWHRAEVGGNKGRTLRVDT